MSGFAAVVPPAGAPVDRALVERMAGFLSFRGPDGAGARVLDGCGLAHSLLLTGDRPEPAGPFSLGGSLHIVCDARLDARADLLRALRGAGHAAMPEAGAAELIARAYRAWGRGCVHRLTGDFAFALWDAADRRLFCARDPLGVKLLYHASPGGSFACSNTLECVRLHPGLDAGLDEPHTPLTQAEYAMGHGRRDGLRAAQKAADAIVGVGEREHVRQRARHEGDAEPSLNGGQQ